MKKKNLKDYKIEHRLLFKNKLAQNIILELNEYNNTRIEIKW